MDHSKFQNYCQIWDGLVLRKNSRLLMCFLENPRPVLL